jgi:peptidoglycan-N-acetylglucosamine deacetylase
MSFFFPFFLIFASIFSFFLNYKTPSIETVKEEIFSIPQHTVYASSYIELVFAPINTDCTKLKCIALTFDDGPSKHTKEILEALKKENVKATFFVLWSHIDKNKDVLKKISEEWHQIGNHTWNHLQLTKLSKEEVQKEIESTSKKIEEITWIRPTVFRPPYWAINKEIEQEMNLPIILWDKDSLDWKRKKISTVVKNATDKAKAGDIILMHDTYLVSTNSVQTIVKKLKSSWFTLVTINDLFWTGWLEKWKVYTRKKY